MEFLIRAAEILQPNTPLHKVKKDILISNGKIAKIEDQIDFDGQIVSAEYLKVSAGWMDMRAHYNDPGIEHKEDLISGTQTALSGGFTDVVLLPNTDPIVSTKNGISYYQRFNESAQVTLHPLAALTIDCEGKEITEMIDLHTAGAVAFSDGLNPVWHTDILLKGLQYLQKFDGLLINKPEDKLLTSFGHMNEGEVSTMLGLKGMPVLSETVMIQRDLSLLAYAGGKIHFSLISSAESVELIREAKAQGLRVTCDVGVNYLKYTDADLSDYDTNLKVNPPYRTETDRLTLIAAVKDGTIDVVVSDHTPHDEECKKLEFDLADFGSTNQQTFYSVMLEVFGDDLDALIDRFSTMPREILGLENSQIAVGNDACLTLFNPSTQWTFDAKTNNSKSVASPLFNSELNGSVVGVVNKGSLFLNEYEA
ncbi:dihydroorotase [Roseivirga misakiensis]|uniref:Dihydroorotase n=1 Tax=Roseivirga misakiensis TaxID=1563681 RepID=A0A1E5SJZ1_9BACT|nr:dihydroorotase [Roseivirga misakiensis]OEJ99447.1 dihydroorotase [Roseivirga misakiensis]